MRLALLFLLVLGGCAAPPMTLTKALLAEPEPHERAWLAEASVWGEVRAVRGRLDAAPGARRLAVDLSFDEPRTLPAHLQTYGRPVQEAGAPRVAATFDLMPTHSRPRWPEDYVAEGCVRAGVALRLHGAEYFHDRSLGGEVTLAGRVPRAAVASRCRPPVRERDPRAWDVGLLPADCASLAKVILAIRAHRWGRLLDLPDGDAVRCEPVAWLGPGDRVLQHVQVAKLLEPWQLPQEAATGYDIADCGLLLRAVDRAGAVEFYRVPLALLREADALTLLRAGDDVAWTRREVWTARLYDQPGPTAAYGDAGLQMVSAAVPYTYGDLVPHSGVGRFLRSLLTPVTATIDVLAWTNPLLQGLVQSMVPERFRPTRSAK